MKVKVVWKLKNFCVHFPQNFAVSLNEIQCIATTCRFVKAHSKFLLHKHCSMERALWTYFFKCMTNIVQSQDTCESICFEFGMMLDMTKFYSSVSLWMTLMLTQGHRVKGKLELVQSFCCKVAWSNLNVHDDWVCKGNDCEEVLKGKYGLFEHLLFLVVFFSCVLCVCFLVSHLHLLIPESVVDVFSIWTLYVITVYWLWGS